MPTDERQLVCLVRIYDTLTAQTILLDGIFRELIRIRRQLDGRAPRSLKKTLLNIETALGTNTGASMNESLIALRNLTEERGRE